MPGWDAGFELHPHTHTHMDTHHAAEPRPSAQALSLNNFVFVIRSTNAFLVAVKDSKTC